MPRKYRKEPDQLDWEMQNPLAIEHEQTEKFPKLAEDTNKEVRDEIKKEKRKWKKTIIYLNLYPHGVNSPDLLYYIHDILYPYYSTESLNTWAINVTDHHKKLVTLYCLWKKVLQVLWEHCNTYGQLNNM